MTFMCAIYLHGIVYFISDGIPAAGGPHHRNDEKDTGRVLERTEAKTGAAERSPDQRKLCGFDRTHI